MSDRAHSQPSRLRLPRRIKPPIRGKLTATQEIPTSQPQSETEQSPEGSEAIAAPQNRNFVIPGASVIVQTEDEPMAIEQLLGIVFAMSASNPECKVRFYIKVEA